MAKHPTHASRRLLRAVRLGEVSEDRLIRLLLDHLEQVCPGCAPQIAAEREGEVPLADYSDSVQRVLQRLRVSRDRKAAEAALREASGLVDSLRGRTLEQRLLRIRNHPERFLSPVLVEALFHEARAALPADPLGSLSWARTAQAINDLAADPYPPHCVRALAFQGNAYRAAGDFGRARTLLSKAQDLLAERDVADADLHAELHSFLGSLYTDLRRFEEATKHLRAAAELYMLLDETEALARVYVKLGNLHTAQGNTEAALHGNWAALELVGARLNPRLYLAARFNLAFNLAEAGRLEEARDALVYDEELYEEHADPDTLIRVNWLEGRILGATGDPVEGERLLRVVRDHFAAREHGFNAALACLDLAGLYHNQGRWADLEEAAAHAVRLFEAHEIHREALAALSMVHDAARRRSLTAGKLRETAALLELERARDASDRPVQIPSQPLHST